MSIEVGVAGEQRAYGRAAVGSLDETTLPCRIVITVLSLRLFSFRLGNSPLPTAAWHCFELRSMLNPRAERLCVRSVSTYYGRRPVAITNSDEARPQSPPEQDHGPGQYLIGTGHTPCARLTRGG